MALKKEALCRIQIKTPNGKEQLWSGTVYKDIIYCDVAKVIDRVSRVLE